LAAKLSDTRLPCDLARFLGAPQRRAVVLQRRRDRNIERWLMS